MTDLPALDEKGLAPCPFCGSDELMLFCDPEEGRDNSGSSRRIQCAGCNIEAPFYSSKAEAVAAWNRRASSAPVSEGEVEAAEAEFYRTQGDMRAALATASAIRALQGVVADREAIIERYASACQRNVVEMQTMPAGVIRQHFREFANEVAALAAPTHYSGEAEPMCFSYRNWRGEIANRRVKPIRIWFGATEWHPDPQWLLRALDLDKNEERDFALEDMMHSSPSGVNAEVVAALASARERIAAHLDEIDADDDGILGEMDVALDKFGPAALAALQAQAAASGDGQ